ncbi:MAG: type II toxin-antitoxin system HicB family antitoxin [Actinobacteria bacterium]|nr:type II toxin-antitoxin system HicB family antitoxin [Actinomycetota bacterium]
MRCIYDALLTPDEDGGYCVTVPDLEGCFTEGNNQEEAILNAGDAIETYVGSLLFDGEPVPARTTGHVAPEGGHVATIFVKAGPDSVTDVVSASEAADRLGVTRSRVSHMIKSGILDARREGRDTKVTIASINARISGRNNRAGDHSVLEM